MANGKFTLGKQSGGTLGLVFPDGVSNTEVMLPESGELATVDYVKNNGDVSAITGFSQISGTNEIVSTEPTDNIHNIFNDGSCVATYTLDGNANDLGGVYGANATNVTYEEGKFGQAAKFNGSSSYISGFNFPNSTNLSISLWVKLDVIPSTSFLYGQANSGWSDATVGVSLALTSNGLRIYQNGPTGKDFNFNFSTGVWYNIVHRVEGTLVSIYIDNTLIGTHNFSSNRLPFNSTNFAFGKNGAHVFYFSGSIDQIRIFNRVLTELEINTLYAETKVSANAQLNINQGTFIYPKGLGARGYKKSSDVFTGTVDVSTQTDGWKYVAKDESNNFSFYTDKPTIGKKSSTLYLENGKLWSQEPGIIIADGSTNTSTTKVTPNMTSNNQDGFILSASTEYSASYNANKAFDGLDDSRWWETSGASSGWLQIQLPSAKIINKYLIIPPQGYANKAPKAWTIQASNAGAFAGEQVTLDSKSDVTGWVSSNYKTFSFINSTPYLYYRIVVTSTGGGQLGIGELQYIEAQVSTGAVTPLTPVSFLSNKVRIASGVAVELAPSDISKTVSESLEAGSYFGKNAVVAYASIDMTTTPPTILDSYNVASVVRSSNGVGKIVLVNPVDKDSITAVCGTNSVAGTVTSTIKSEINFTTGATNYAKTTIIAIGGKF